MGIYGGPFRSFRLDAEGEERTAEGRVETGHAQIDYWIYCIGSESDFGNMRLEIGHEYWT